MRARSSDSADSSAQAEMKDFRFSRTPDDFGIVVGTFVNISVLRLGRRDGCRLLRLENVVVADFVLWFWEDTFVGRFARRASIRA